MSAAIARQVNRNNNRKGTCQRKRYLEVHHLRKSVGQEHQLSILTGVELVVKPRQTIALIGESGSGYEPRWRSSPASTMAAAGRSMLGKPLHRMDEEARAALRAQHVGFVFQLFTPF